MGSAAVRITQVAVSTPFDNSTNGFTANNVQAAIEEARNSPGVNMIQASASINTTSTTDVVMTGQTYTNATGAAIKVVAEFNGDVTISATGGVLSTSFYLNGVQIADTLRKQMADQGALAGPSRFTASLLTKVTIPNGQTLDVRWSTSTGTITAAGRVLMLTRCGDF